MVDAENVRDGVAMAGAALLEWGRMVRERVERRAGLPPSSAHIRANWLSAALQTEFPGARVESIRRISRQCGTTDRARLSVAYSRSGGGAAPPSSIFVKVTPTPARTRLFVNLMHLGQREVEFYRAVAPQLGVERPRVFHAQHDGRGGRFVLVCEDLVARGARFVDAATPVTFDEARAVVRELARLHAPLWQSPRLDRDLAWLKPRRGGTRPRVERFARRVATDAAMRSFGDLVPAALPARIVAMRRPLEDAWAEPPLTLIHGEVQAGNVYFAGEGAGFVDWQHSECGQGMRDVTQFLSFSLSVDLRRRHERALIAAYLDALGRAGAPAPDLERAWTQHRLHALYAWTAAAFAAGAVTKPAERVARAHLERTNQAVLDLGSLGALEELGRRAS